MPLVFVLIIAACATVELALTGAALAGWPAVRLGAFAYGGFYPQMLDDWPGLFPGQRVTMFATYGFLHAGLLHLTMNMLALAQLAREMATVMAARAMLLIYAVSQVGAALAQAALAPEGPVMVGASGAIFGLAGALIARNFVVVVRRRLPLGPLVRSAATLVVLNVALALLVPQIAWQAHVGGAATGAVLGIAQAVLTRKG